MDGALLVAASIVAAIRLRGQEITLSPKLVAVVGDSVLLARTVMAAIERGQVSRLVYPNNKRARALSRKFWRLI